tara:strand:+ start:140 stop:328 length:189 start_codon:yes stop_codon:yes gene_type:complete
MCLICVDLQKDKITSEEARSNLDELHSTMKKGHIHEVLQLIWKKEDDEYAEEYNFDNHGDTD